MIGKKKPAEPFQVNEALLNAIAPMGLEIKRNSLVIGENLGKVYGAVRYPQKVDMGWLSKITNIPSTIVSVGMTPIDNGSLISAISKSIIQNRGAADSAKDPLTRQRAEKAAEDGERIMQQIDQEGETVAMMSLAVMPVAQDDKQFEKVCRRVESAFHVQKCKVRSLANLQREGFQNISPLACRIHRESLISRMGAYRRYVRYASGNAVENHISDCVFYKQHRSEYVYGEHCAEFFGVDVCDDVVVRLRGVVYVSVEGNAVGYEIFRKNLPPCGFGIRQIDAFKE